MEGVPSAIGGDGEKMLHPAGTDLEMFPGAEFQPDFLIGLYPTLDQAARALLIQVGGKGVARRAEPGQKSLEPLDHAFIVPGIPARAQSLARDGENPAQERAAFDQATAFFRDDVI